ncbi:hypothetical protein CC80DRAFT_20840 [Byssothecium circinans]|uniref:Apple domain-containing protein n=1 Tax=Byssothecium circinans TaxID=147558 RepID=A0A6A5U1V5_9PLEO|nr:hypothetical protein CC80DRAFT_20840 [Byssothecium circinans]
MKTQVLLAAAFAVSVSGLVIEARQGGRPTTTQPQPAPTGDLVKCGLDSFEGHDAEAGRFCSSLLKSGTATRTSTAIISSTTTVQTTIYTTLYPPTSTSRPPTSTKPTTSTRTTITPSPTPTAGCGIVGYTRDVPAFYFDSSGTKNTFAACSAACKADATCKSFGYGESNCLLFTVDATSNTSINPTSPYVFYDVSCPRELPVRNKRQVTVSLSIGDPAKLSSACSCYIGTGPAGVTRTTTITNTNKATATSTVTRTVSLLPGLQL